MTAHPQFYDWLTLAAILLGPLVGIWVTRLVDSAKAEKDRRWAIFEGLIRTRGLELSPDHVSNLNMVPLIFAKDAKVTAQHSSLMLALNDAALRSEDPSIYGPAGVRLNTARQNLVVTVGRSVGANLPDGLLERLGYAPIAWETDYQEGQRLRRDLIDVVAGRKAMHMVAGIWELQASPSSETSAVQPTDPPHKLPEPEPPS